MSTQEYVQIAKNLRQWYLEDRPQASSYAYTMATPQILAPFLETVYARLLRNRRYFLKLKDVGWGREDPFYKWLRRYFDTTDFQHPDQSGVLIDRPAPLLSIEEGLRHLTNKFKEEFAAQDTMLVREKERLDTYMAMNGEDNDCHWSYTGPGGGQFLHPVNTKSVGYDGVDHDNVASELWYHREHTDNPTSLYGTLLRQQEALAQRDQNMRDFSHTVQTSWLEF